MKKYFIPLILLAICLDIYAQNTFERTYGGPDVDQGQIVMEIDDSTLAIMGSAKFYGNTSYSQQGLFLSKINSAGDTLWTQCYPGIFRSGITTSDAGFLLVGYLDLYSLYAVKTDSVGDTLWTTQFGSAYSGARGAVETPDQEYILCGHINHGEEKSADVYLAKLNSSGDTIWTKTYGTTLTESARTIIPTSDSNYLVGAWSDLGTWLLKIDDEGEILWETLIESEISGYCYEIHETADSGFIVTGDGDQAAFLMKTDKNGVLEWSKNYGNTMIGRSVEVSHDGGYIISSITNTYGDSDGDILLIKTDESGDVIWSKLFGGLDYDNPARVTQAVDSSIWVIGQTKSYGAGNTDIYLIKTDRSGGVDSTINELDYEINVALPTDKYTCDGSVHVAVRGGKPPYTYFFNGQPSTDSINDLCDEKYVVEAHDQYGNEISEWVSLLIEKIDSIVVIPENPTILDSTYLNIYSKMKWSVAEPGVSIDEYDIIVNLKYVESGYLDSIQQVTAEVQLGQLEAGDYDVLILLGLKHCNFELECDSITYDQEQFLLHVSVPISIEASSSQKRLIIYPNPVTDQTSVYFGAGHESDITVKIFNPAGQQILSIPCSNKNTNIGRYMKSSGIYHYAIYKENAIIGTGKLIRQ